MILWLCYIVVKQQLALWRMYFLSTSRIHRKTIWIVVGILLDIISILVPHGGDFRSNFIQVDFNESLSLLIKHNLMNSFIYFKDFLCFAVSSTFIFFHRAFSFNILFIPSSKCLYIIFVGFEINTLNVNGLQPG